MQQSSAGIPRHWWGKIIGAFLGLLRGGISGAVIGALLGHLVDRFIAGLTGVRNTRQLFFRTLFATLGHVNKADGRVTQAEIQAAESLMRRLGLTPEERQLAIRYFREGKQPDYPMEKHLHEFARHTMMRHDLRQMLMEILLEAAAADGSVSRAEQQVLARAAHALHIPAELFAAMWNARQGGAAGGQYRQAGGQAPGRQTVPLAQAFAALGLSEGASDAEVKRAYRKLVAQYHPDKLVSRGLPEEMMEVARKRVREINAAYERVKQARGFK
jgi:DnaJ like chaperone protein